MSQPKVQVQLHDDGEAKIVTSEGNNPIVIPAEGIPAGKDVIMLPQQAQMRNKKLPKGFKLEPVLEDKPKLLENVEVTGKRERRQTNKMVIEAPAPAPRANRKRSKSGGRSNAGGGGGGGGAASGSRKTGRKSGGADAHDDSDTGDQHAMAIPPMMMPSMMGYPMMDAAGGKREKKAKKGKMDMNPQDLIEQQKFFLQQQLQYLNQMNEGNMSPAAYMGMGFPMMGMPGMPMAGMGAMPGMGMAGMPGMPGMAGMFQMPGMAGMAGKAAGKGKGKRKRGGREDDDEDDDDDDGDFKPSGGGGGGGGGGSGRPARAASAGVAAATTSATAPVNEALVLDAPVGPPPGKKYKGKGRQSEAFKFAVGVIRRLRENRNAGPFNQPVDPVKLGIPDYPTIVTKPMDFGTIKKRLDDQYYSTLEEWADDCRQVFKNCRTYNPAGSPIVAMCDALSEIFEKKWETRPMDNSMAFIFPEPVAQQARGASAAQKAARPSTATLVNQIDSLKQEIMAIKGGAGVGGDNDDIDARDMTDREKYELGVNINKLPGEKIGHVIDIIAQVQSLSGSDDEVEIDIDALDPVTLRKLESYVNSVLEEQNEKNAEKRKRAAERKAAAAAAAAAAAPPSTSDVAGGALGTGDEDVVVDDEAPATGASGNAQLGNGMPGSGNGAGGASTAAPAAAYAGGAGADGDGSSSDSGSASGSDSSSEGDQRLATEAPAAKVNEEAHDSMEIDQGQDVPAPAILQSEVDKVSEKVEVSNLESWTNLEEARNGHDQQQSKEEGGKDEQSAPDEGDNKEGLWSAFQSKNLEKEQRLKEQEELEERIRKEREKLEEEKRAAEKRKAEEAAAEAERKKKELLDAEQEKERQREQRRLAAKAEREKLTQTVTINEEADMMGNFSFGSPDALQNIKALIEPKDGEAKDGEAKKGDGEQA